MHILIIRNYQKDHTINSQEKEETLFFPVYVCGGIFDTQGQITLKSVVASGRNSNVFQILCMFSFTYKFKMDLTNSDREKVET